MPSAVELMTTALPSLELLMKALLFIELWRRDPKVVPISWRDNECVRQETKLCFSTLPFDGIVQPHPPILRGIGVVSQALQHVGHRVSSTPQFPLQVITPLDTSLGSTKPCRGYSNSRACLLPPSSCSHLHQIPEPTMASDGGADVFKQLRLSGESLIPEKQSGRHKDSPIPPISVLEYQDLALRRRTYRESYADYWESTKPRLEQVSRQTRME